MTAEVTEAEPSNESAPGTRSEVARELDREMYKVQEAELFKRELSNSENYDKGLLAYASGGLGLSLAFIKDVVPIGTARCDLLLKLSWLSWVATILLVLLSFQVSQWAIRRQLDVAARYYLDGHREAINEVNIFAEWTGRVNIGAGLLFLCGVILTTIFVWINLGSADVTKTTHTMDGAPVPRLQQAAVPAVPKPALKPEPKPAPPSADKTK